MKTTRHSLMAKGIMVLLSLMILIFIFTYSWFANPEDPVTASGISFNTSAAADIEIALGFKTPDTNNTYVVTNYSDGSLDFERLEIPAELKMKVNGVENTVVKTQTPHSGENALNLLADFSPVDLTGNGVYLVRPSMQAKNRSIDETTREVGTIAENVQYISFDIIIRCPAAFRVSLVNGSYVVSAAEAFEGLEGVDLDNAIEAGETPIDSDAIDSSELKGSDVARKSSYGNFSEDSVVGAVRVSFTSYSNTGVTSSNFYDDLQSTNLNSTPSLLWIPRPDIYLQNVVSGGVETKEDWVLHTDSDGSSWTTSHALNDTDNSDSGYTYAEAAKIHKFYYVTPDSQGTYITLSENNVSYLKTELSDSGSNSVIVEPIFSDGDYYYGKCRVNLWLEGCDAEARRAIDGGKFFFGFSLKSVS